MPSWNDRHRDLLVNAIHRMLQGATRPPVPAAVTLAALSWVLDSLVDALVFRTSGLADSFLRPGPEEVWERIVVAGLAAALCFYAHDVKRRGRVEEELRRSGQRNRDLIENSLGLISTHDWDGVTLSLNPAAASALGYEPSEMIGRKMSDFLSPSVAHLFDDYLKRIRRDGVATGIMRVTGKGGEESFWAYRNVLRVEPGVPPYVLGHAQDVTDLKRVERELASTRSRLEHILSASPAITYSAELGYGTTFISPNVKDLLGYDASTFTDDPGFWNSRIHPDDRETLSSAIAATVESGQCRHEYRVQHADGTYRWICDELRFVSKERQGKSKQIVGYRIDVTDRQEAEEEVAKFAAEFENQVGKRTAQLGGSYELLRVEFQQRQRAEARFRRLVEHGPDAMVIINREGRITLVNQQSERLFGYTAQEMVGQSVEFLMPRRHRHKHRERRTSYSVKPTLQTMGERDVELYGLRKDGTEFPVEISLGPLEHDGEFLVASAIRDVSERKLAEDALRRSEANYRGLVDHAIHGVYRSSPNGSFLTVNPALVEMLGYDSQTELLAVDMVKDIYVDPAERKRLLDEWRKVGQTKGMEIHWKRKDGKRITVRLSGRSVFNEAGELEHFEVIAEDVTEHRKLESQLRQAQKMEAIGQLTGGIAHDLNNLLTVIMSNAELIDDRIPPDQTGAGEELEELKAAAHSGADLIKRLLGFSRRRALVLEAVDLRNVVAETSKLMRTLLPESIEVNVSADSAGDRVMADPTAIEQILLNLATNSRDAMPDGGEIVIDTGARQIDEDYHTDHPWIRPGDYVCISFSDTGVGMDEETQARVFEPFFTTKPTGAGTGLGMAMIYGLVKQHEGFVHVYSAVGQGTTVRLYFPITDQAASATPKRTTKAESQGGTETILLVEDEPSPRRSTTRVLEKFGYTVVAACNGEEAVELFETGGSQIDLVISDLIMPKMGGPELRKELRRRGVSVPFLFSSGYAAGDRTSGTYLEPGTPFLHKPWTIADLLTQVREVLEGGNDEQL
ncbi:MAG: PAS domain S-box protein [Gemmatimonadales bacterium]